MSCATGPVTTAQLQPSASLIPGQDYTALVNPTGTTAPIVDMGGNPAVAASSAFRASTAEEESSAAARYAWRTVIDSNAAGGSYTVEHLAGARTAFSFIGTSVTWITVTGPAQGLANVYLDGVLGARLTSTPPPPPITSRAASPGSARAPTRC